MMAFASFTGPVMTRPTSEPTRYATASGSSEARAAVRSVKATIRFGSIVGSPPSFPTWSRGSFMISGEPPAPLWRVPGCLATTPSKFDHHTSSVQISRGPWRAAPTTSPSRLTVNSISLAMPCATACANVSKAPINRHGE
jgi:hypothetical protein